MVLRNLFSGFVLTIISLVAFTSCSTDRQENVEMHPIKSKIPHVDNNHLPIDTVNNSSSIDNFPKIISEFRNILDDSISFNIKELNLLIGDSEPGTKVIAIDDNRLAVLDADNNKLYEYDLDADTSTVIAEEGRGPGDIMFTADMVKQEGDLYVLGKNMVISQFNARSKSLKFDKVIPLDFRPISVGIAGDSMAVLGTPEIDNTSGSKLSEDNQPDRKVLYLTDNNGDLIKRFGSSYDISGHWMLIRPLVGNGTVRYSPKEDIFVQTFSRFPFVYVYDAQSLKLLKSYQIKNFKVGKQQYWPDEGRLKTIQESNSSIGNVQIIDEKYLWVEVENWEGYNDENKPIWQNRWDDYYLINLESDKTFYLGNQQIDEDHPDQKYHFTEGQIFITTKGQLYSVN